MSLCSWTTIYVSSGLPEELLVEPGCPKPSAKVAAGLIFRKSPKSFLSEPGCFLLFDLMTIVYTINVTKIWKMSKTKIKFRKNFGRKVKKMYTNP